MAIDPREIVMEFLRARLTDPRARHTATSDDFTGDASAVTFTLTPSSSNSAMTITSITTKLQHREYTSDSNTVALWHLNEATATTATDSSSNSFDLTASGTTVDTSGKFGNARTISSGTDTLTKTHETKLSLENSPWTVEGWFKTTNTTQNQMIMDKGDAQNQSDGWHVLITVGGSLEMITRGMTGNTAHQMLAAAIPTARDGNWHHFAFTWDGSNVRGYFDGGLEKTSVATGSVATNTDDFTVGGTQADTARFFDGSLDEIRISDVQKTVFETLKKWEDYTIDLQNSQVTFLTAPALNEEITVNYGEGTTSWIYKDKPRTDLSSTSFPRMHVGIVSAPDFRTGAHTSDLHSTIHFQLMCWAKEGQIFTIGGRKYEGPELTFYFINQARLAFKDNEDDVYPNLHSYRTVTMRPDLPMDENYQAFPAVLEFELQGENVGE